MTGGRLLVTGFDPFGDLAINTSQLVVEHLARTAFDRFTLDTRILPTAYARSFAVVEQVFERAAPDAMVMFGVAGSIGRFSIETRAANVRSTELPDNDGFVPDEPAIDTSGPNALSTTVDAEALLALLKAEGVDAHLSDDAGDYLCNFTYYTLLRWVAANKPQIPALFVHVPDLSGPDGTAAPSPELPRLQEDATTLLRLFAGLVLDGAPQTR